MLEIPYLSLVIWTPIIGGLWVLIASAGKSTAAVRPIALVVSLLAQEHIVAFLPRKLVPRAAARVARVDREEVSGRDAR